MPERLKAILDKITAWWKKFNTKQRSVLISIVAVVIVALVILGDLLRPATKLCWLQPRSLPQSPIHIHCLKHCIRDLISIRQKYAYALYPTGLRQKRMAV